MSIKQLTKFRMAHQNEASIGQTNAEFFYSDKLKKYISNKPLKVSSRVIKAASALNISLQWDEEGRVNNISFADAKNLLHALGSTMLSPSEYWIVHEEAKELQDKTCMEELKSETFSEWLDAIFEREVSDKASMIEHPEQERNNDKVVFTGDIIPIHQPFGCPGWFNPQNNIDSQTGIPLEASTSRAKGTQAWTASTWKYWSTPQVKNMQFAGSRGYVISSGTPSFDLAIPAFARHPSLMIRECRDELLEFALGQDIVTKADTLYSMYLETTAEQPMIQNGPAHERFYALRYELYDILTKNGKEIIGTKDIDALTLKERITDMLGIVRLEAIRRNDTQTLEDFTNLTRYLFGINPEQVHYQGLIEYISHTRDSLRSALKEKKPIVFVMGHKNPDTDTAVSALFEAYRNYLIDQSSVYIPILQASKMPEEINHLLGEDITRSYVKFDEKDYLSAKDSGQSRWILVDHNKSEQQKFAVSIIDHHILSDVAKKQSVSRTWEMIGSCAGQITQKLFGNGIPIDSSMARILHGATLMDTEGRSPLKMTYRDILIMDLLEDLSGVSDENKFYQDLMSYLLNTDDAMRLFTRDYKQDWGTWGFAVAKVKNAFTLSGRELKSNLISQLVSKARANNTAKNFPLTLVKLVNYMNDNQTVDRERIYLIFNDHVSEAFRQTMFAFIERLVVHKFKGKAQVKRLFDAVEYSGVGSQLSRKIIAPKIEPLVEAFNRFYYSPSIDRYVARDFLKPTAKIQQAAQKLGIQLSVNKEGKINNITFIEAKMLLDRIGYSMLSLPEYWQVYNDAQKTHDEQLQKHLVSKELVELLDTVYFDHTDMINHPKILVDYKGNIHYSGKRSTVSIPEAYPGLIYPDEINKDTGLPSFVHSPDSYGDKRVWRYWSPDEDIAIPTRGYIFLLDKPALDAKIHPNDALKNLGIRLTTKDVKPPKVRFVEVDNELKAKIIEEN